MIRRAKQWLLARRRHVWIAAAAVLLAFALVFAPAYKASKHVRIHLQYGSPFDDRSTVGSAPYSGPSVFATDTEE